MMTQMQAVSKQLLDLGAVRSRDTLKQKVALLDPDVVSAIELKKKEYVAEALKYTRACRHKASIATSLAELKNGRYPSGCKPFASNLRIQWLDNKLEASTQEDVELKITIPKDTTRIFL